MASNAMLDQQRRICNTPRDATETAGGRQQYQVMCVPTPRRAA